MKLSNRTLEKLRIIINGDDTASYRKGYQLVSFFNELGFQDVYGQGFPSRWVYTDDRLQKINGTPELDKCIRKAFAVVDYIGRVQELDALIADFNRYLAFDKWAVVRENENIAFKHLNKIIIEDTNQASENMKEDDFLKLTFDVNVDLLGLNTEVSDIIKMRLKEVEACIRNDAPLASVILIGSILEGILLGTVELRNMVTQVIKYYTDFQNNHVKHNDKVNSNEIEYVIELTSVVMKFLIKISGGTN